MLYLSSQIKEQLIRHALREAPNEACGILAGKDDRVEKVYEMTNTQKSPESFLMDPREQLKVMKDIRNSNLEMLGIYHSHPHSKAYPSRRDIDMAYYSSVVYIIISLADKMQPVICGYKIVDGEVFPYKLVIE